MKWYRRGHNEADSKSVSQYIAGTWVRIPPTSPKIQKNYHNFIKSVNDTFKRYMLIKLNIIEK